MELFQQVSASSGTAHTEFGDFANVGTYVTAVLRWANPIIASLAVLMLIIAGYMYMTSQGNPDQIKKAKEIIIGVVLGVALLYLASLLFNTIGIDINYH